MSLKSVCTPLEIPLVYFSLFNRIFDYLGRDNPNNRSEPYKSLESFISGLDSQALFIPTSYHSLINRVCDWLGTDCISKQSIQYKVLLSLTSLKFEGVSYFLSSSNEEVLKPFAFLGFYPLPRSFVQEVIQESEFIYNSCSLADFLSF